MAATDYQDAAENDHGDHEDAPAAARMSGSAVEILWHSALLILPMLSFSGVLLGLVFFYRVRSNQSEDTFGDTVGIQDIGVFYVYFSATRLMFIASWCSSVAPLFVSSALVLVSYAAAETVLLSTRPAKDTLPTPYQLTLVLRMLSGDGYGSLCKWLAYVVGGRKRRCAQSPALKSVSSVLVLIVGLSLLVFLADTWLHVTTSSIVLPQVNPAIQLPKYSVHLNRTCFETEPDQDTSDGLSTAALACAVRIAATNTFLSDVTTSYAVLGNTSDSMMATTLEASVPYVYLGVPDNSISAQMDYTAITYGMQTQCTAISTLCNLYPSNGASTPFHCTPAFQGDVTREHWQMTYFLNATMTVNSIGQNGVHNPYYFGWAALIDASGGATIGYENPEMVVPMHGGTSFVLACNSTIYDIEYDSVNGTITRLVVQPSNASVTNIVQLPMSLTTVSWPYLQQAASVAIFSETVREAVDRMALAYSRAAISISAQSMISAPAIRAQRRTSLLVARVPAAPLFTLIAANLLFVVAGMVLLVVALRVPTVVREGQARLSIAGLVAYAFEAKHGSQPAKNMKELFEETEGQQSVRIGIGKTAAGGYVYREFRNKDYDVFEMVDRED